MPMKTIGVIVGSLRRESINRKLAEAIAKLTSSFFRLHFIEIGDLPLYNEDLWLQPPQSVLRAKREIEACDALLFVTPEYNRSFTPAIKNVVDWGTRPWGKNSWAGKPAGLIGASPGAIGSAVGQNALKSLLSVVGLILMGQPEVYLAYKPEAFDVEGNVIDDNTQKFLQGWAEAFDRWIERVGEPCAGVRERAAVGC
jgi:chromate reductase, NAD(P)H dehydrogenase (quinone)